MTHAMDEQEALIRAFVVKRKQARLIELLGNPERRQDVIRTFYHFHNLDPRFIIRLPSNEQSPDSIARALAARGAGDTCYALSTDSDLDGKRLPLDAALEQVVGSGNGTFLSCVPGTLAYFEDEDDRFILLRPGASQ